MWQFVGARGIRVLIRYDGVEAGGEGGASLDSVVCSVWLSRRCTKHVYHVRLKWREFRNLTATDVRSLPKSAKSISF